MCQAIRDGGRRCPKHQHISRAVLNGVSAKHGLTNAQTESLLAELRREGRNTELPEANVLQTNLKNIADSFANDGNSLSPSERDKVTEQYQKFVDTNESAQVDGATYYALQTIDARAKQRKETLNSFLNDIRDQTGLTLLQLRRAYLRHMSSTDTTRNGEVPSEYTVTTRAQAVRAGLPYDRASVVAIEKLKKLPIKQRRRIERVAVNNSQLASYGYDEGRLEVTMHDAPDAVLAYQNVPAALYNRMVDSPRPARIFATLRQNPDYQYESFRDAVRDGFRYRCAACGQFAAATGHSCPEREQNEEEALNALRAMLLTQETRDERTTTSEQVNTDTETVDPLSVVLAQVNHIDLTEVDEATTISDEEALEISTNEAEADAIPVEIIEETNPITEEEANEPEVLLPTTTDGGIPQSDIPAISNISGDSFTPEERAEQILETSLLGEANDPYNLLQLTTEERQQKAEEIASLIYGDIEETAESQQNGTTQYGDGEIVRVANFIPTGKHILPIDFGEKYTYLASSSIDGEHLKMPYNELSYHSQLMSDFFDAAGMTHEEVKAIVESTEGPNIEYVFIPNPNQAGAYNLVPVDTTKTRVRVLRNHMEGTRSVVFEAKIGNPLGQNPETNNEDIRAEKQRLETLVEEGKAVRVAQVATHKVSTKVPHVKFALGKVADLRKALKDNPDKIITASASIKMSDISTHQTTIPAVALAHNNKTGYSRQNSYHVDGDIGFRRLPDGKIEIVSSRTLKCDCNEYRKKYYCAHVYLAKARLTTLIQGALPSAEGTTRANRGGIGEDGILRKPDSLSDKENIIVTQNTNEEGEPEGEQFYKFTNSLSSSYSNRNNVRDYRRIRRDIFSIPANDMPQNVFVAGSVLNRENFADVERDQSLNGFAKQVNLPRSLAGLKTLLSKANVELPIEVSSTSTPGMYYGRSRNITTSGTVTLKKLERGETDYTADSSNLRCSCDEYVSNNYHCIHTRMIVENANQLFKLNSTNMRNEYVNPERLDINDAAWAFDPQTRNEMLEDYRHILNSGTNYEGTSQYLETVTNENGVEVRQITTEGEESLIRVREERAEAVIREAAAAQRRREEEIERQRIASMSIRERNAETIEASEAYRANMLQRWENVDPGYTENPDQFYNDYKAALKRKRDGENPIPFVTENVTDGICAEGEGTRSFGVEIEFDFPDDIGYSEKSDRLRKIGEEMKEAGLTSTSRQQRYHSASGTGWSEWSFEEDCTVSGEIVSPLMKDTPEHWEQLRKVCEIVNRNGGVASRRTGSHVHISTGSYETNTAKHAELLRQTTEHQETLFRLASDPKRGSHRGTDWCAPNAVDNLSEELSHEGEEHSHREFLRGNNNHGVAMNFQGTGNQTYKKSHVEFRMWDGTIDPAVIQQQVAISAAMTDVAEKTVMQEGKSKRKAREDLVRIGDMHSRELAVLDGNPRKTHTKDTLAVSSAPAMEFMDKFFRKQEDRERIAALFAVTNWVR